VRRVLDKVIDERLLRLEVLAEALVEAEEGGLTGFQDPEIVDKDEYTENNISWPSGVKFSPRDITWVNFAP
jgi:hypothetical protein